MSSSLKKQEDTRTFTVSITTDAGIITLEPSDIMQFYFVEDIFSMSITGKIVMVDKRGLLECGPLTGNEKLGLIYGEEEDIEKEFKIYNVSKISKLETVDPSGKNVIEVFFADLMFFPLNFLQFSRVWKDKKFSDIIKDIGENFLGIKTWDKFEDCKETIPHFYSPYWNANTCIKWLMKRCSSAKTNKTGYCFYNTTYGSNLIPLNSLLENKNLLTLNGEDDGLYAFEDANLFLYNKILDWNMSGLDNSALRFVGGGTRLGFNNSKKEFIKQSYKYKDLLQNHVILGNKSLYSDISVSSTCYGLTGESERNIIDNIFNDFWIKKYSMQQSLSITVWGHEKRKPGELIEIFWPSKWVDEHYNKGLHGKFLIKSITHSFNSKTTPFYIQKLILLKNGLEENSSKDILDAVNKNIVTR